MRQRSSTRRPEATLLHQLVARCPEFVAVREAAGRPLPKYVKEEFAAYLKGGRLKHGFLRARCGDVTPRSWSRSAVSAAAFVPPAAPDRGVPEGRLRQAAGICIAKTQYSFSTDPQLRGAPAGHVFNVRDVYLNAGAGFMVVLSARS